MDSPPRLSLLATLLLCVSFIIYGQDTQGLRDDAGDAPLLSAGSGNLVLTMSGVWEGKGLGVLGFTRSGPVFGALSTGSPLLFTQEADLGLDLRINRRWFLRADFLDDYALNTYAAGYRGEPGEVLQYLGLGNTGLDFPSFPYLDLGGDSPSSIGVYARFGGERLVFHGLFRYDMAAREERVFQGNRERRQVWLSLDAMERGRAFALPDGGLDAPPELYAEAGDGELRDSRGRRWRKLGAGEYGAGALLGLVELGIAPGTALAVSYSKNGDPRPWETSMGAYDAGVSGGGAAPGTGSGFLGEVSRAFGPAVDLRLWPQPGENPGHPHEPGRDRLSDGTDILIIWERGGFSPFERMNRYRSPTSAADSARLLRLSGGSGEGARAGGYELFARGEIQGEVPFYDQEDREVWELRVSGEGADPRSPRSRWPLLAEGRAELYLPGNLAFNADMALCFTGYGSAGDLVIGSDVVPGSIRVYRGGVEDGEFGYEEGTGRVVLRRAPGENETIRISYLKQGRDAGSGSLAAGLGAEYRGEHFAVRSALGFRRNLEPAGAAGRGTLGLGTGASWDYGDFSARLRGGLGFDIPDAGALYRVAGMEGGEQVLPLPEDSFVSPPPGGMTGFSPPVPDRGNRAALVYRNYREDRLGGPVLMYSDWEAEVTAGREGPYPVRDKALSSRVLAAEFGFDAATVWTGFQVPLGEAAALLEGAKLVEIPFRLDGFDALSAASFPASPPAAAGDGHGGDFSVVVQFGALRDGALDFDEYPAALVEKQIYPQPGNADPNNPASYSGDARIALVRFDDEDRRKLRGATAMRIIVVKNRGLSRAFGGRVMLGPPVLRGASFRAVTAGPGGISAAWDRGGLPSAAAVERPEAGAGSLESACPGVIRRLHPGGGQRILELRWDGFGTRPAAVGVEGRVASVPLGAYRSLSFFVRPPAAAGAVLRLFLARGSESLMPWPGGNKDEIFLEAEIPLDALPALSWSKVELRYGDGEIRVNGGGIGGGSLRYRPAALPAAAAGSEERGTYVLFLLDKTDSGVLGLDEIILEDAVSSYQVSAGATLRWNRGGTLVSWRGLPLLEEVRLGLDLEGAFREALGHGTGGGNGGGKGQTGYSGRASGEAGVLGAELSAYLGFSGAAGAAGTAGGGAESPVSWNGGHDFSRSLGPLGLGESFSFDGAGSRADHRFSLELADPSDSVSFRSQSAASYQGENRGRRWDLSLGLDPAGIAAFLPALSLGAGFAWTAREGDAESRLNDYGGGWLRTWAAMIPDSGEGENKREGKATALVSKDLGALGFALSLEGKITASVPQVLSRSEALVRLDLPLKFGAYRLDFRGERALLRDLRAAGGNGGEDAEFFAEFLRDTGPLWLSVPLYALGDPGLPGRLEKSGAGAVHEYSRFREGLSLNLALPPGTGARALWIPLEIGAALGRTAERKLDTVFDLLDFSGTLDYSSANLFGAWGARPLFLFYGGDEFDHSLQTVLAFPRGEAVSWRLVSSVRLGFFGFNGGEFGLSNRLTLGSYKKGASHPKRPLNWVESLGLRWERPSERSLAGALWDYGMAVLKPRASWLALSGIPEAPCERRLRDYLELALDRSGDYLDLSLTGGHESHIVITGRLDFSLFLELGCGWNEKTGVLSVSFSTGAGLRVSF